MHCSKGMLLASEDRVTGSIPVAPTIYCY